MTHIRSRAACRFLLATALASLAAALANPAAAVVSQIATYPEDGARRVPPDATILFVFDQPTLKDGAFSVADLDPSSGGGVINIDAPIWSAAGDTVHLKPSAPLALGHLFGMRVNRISATDGSVTFDLPIVYFTVLARARVERVQTDNIGLALTPDVPLPVSIPVRETANTDAYFTSARIQFLTSPEVASTSLDTDTLDMVVMPIHQTTEPISIFLPRNGAARLEAPVTLPGSVARTIPQGRLGIRLTFYGSDETLNPVVVDAVFRVDPATVAAHPVSLVPAMASDVIVQSATLEWPPHGATFAAGDTILPRAVVTGNGSGPFRAAFYMDGDLISIEEGFMEGGRPVEVAMRGPLPTRRLGEHRLEFRVEAPQTVVARAVSILCAPPPSGLGQPGRVVTRTEPPPARASRLTGSATWIAEGRTHFRSEDASAVGWGAWRLGYEIAGGRRLEAEVSMRLRFDEIGNGSGAPQRMLLRYRSPRASLEWSDAPPSGAAETPLLMSPVPRRAAQASLARTPIGDLDGYVAVESRPFSAGGAILEPRSDLYAARLTRSLAHERVRATVYGGYTHEDPTPGAGDPVTRRRLIYGAMGRWDISRAWRLLADGATVRHRAVEGLEPGRSRTAWRGEISGRAAGFAARAQAFSYQPDLATALNPYALSNRRGGFAGLERLLLNWRLFGNFRSEQPAERTGLEPTVRVDRGAVGIRLALNQDSWVTPSFVRVTHRGANTEFTENRVATEFSTAERMGGRTTARFDVVVSEDSHRSNTRRRLASGSLVSTRRHPGRVVSTLTLGLEQSRLRDLDITDTTFQGSFEARWEALPGRLLVTPFIAGTTRTYEQQDTKEGRYSARLQISLLRVPGLGENSISLEGRIDRMERTKPSGPSSTEGSAQLTLGHRFDLGGGR
ncbi:MAG: hypothetical protein HY568_00660 [Candidatus Latescibacteria bacterium]|nr:hypothetical protein [Candidatus Latescibacterota bacterium]